MTYHEKPALVLYRNNGRNGIFTETFLNPLKIRKPNEVESLDIDKMTLKTMLEEAYVPPPPPTRELDVQAMFDRYRIKVESEKENFSVHNKTNIISFIMGASTTISLIMSSFGTIITALLALLWLVLLLLVYIT